MATGLGQREGTTALPQEHLQNPLRCEQSTSELNDTESNSSSHTVPQEGTLAPQPREEAGEEGDRGQQQDSREELCSPWRKAPCAQLSPRHAEL